MPPSPFQPRDIICVLASIDQTLYSFFYNNLHLPTVSKAAGTSKSSSSAPNVSSPPTRDRSVSGPVRPGVVLEISRDHATIAVITTFRGKALSDIRAPLRHMIATIHPVNKKHDAAGSALAVYPTWRIPETAKHSFCLCLKYQVPVSELRPWNWKDEPALVGEEPKMCKGDFKVLQQLCERNESLRGLFVSEIKWFFEELGLCDWWRGSA